MRTRGRARRTAPIQSSSSSEGEDDIAVAFYDRNLRPAAFVCPSSDSTRQNPCPINTARKKKTQITNHLRNTLEKPERGDDQHPPDDPLWQSRLVKEYYLIKRPKLTEDQKKKGLQRTNKRSYRKRVRRQDKELPDAQVKWRKGEMDTEEYRKLLVGSERIQFDNDQKVAEVQERLGARIEELRSQARQGNVDGVELQRMEALQQELMETKRLVDTHKNNSIQIARRLVSFFGGPNAETSILATGKDLISCSGVEYLSQVEIDTYYWWAALLLAKHQWEDEIEFEKLFSDKTTRLHLKALVGKIAGDRTLPDEEKKKMRDSLGAFNSSCDVIAGEYEKCRRFGVDIDTQVFVAEQRCAWNFAKDSVSKILSKSFTGGASSVWKVNRAVDQMRRLVDELDEADSANQAAATAATNALAQ